MTNEQKERLNLLNEEYYEWWGWEEGYTYEDASNFFDHMAVSFQALLQEIEANDNEKE